MIKKSLFILLVLLIFCPIVVAEDFYEITRNSKNDVFYFNFKNGFDRHGENIIGFWVKKYISNSNPYSKTNKITHSQNYVYANCSNHTYYIKDTLYYDVNNNHIDGERYNDTTFKKPQPGSLVYDVIDFACWYKKDIYDAHIAPGYPKYDKSTCPEFCNKRIKYCATFHTCNYKLTD